MKKIVIALAAVLAVAGQVQAQVKGGKTEAVRSEQAKRVKLSELPEALRAKVPELVKLEATKKEVAEAIAFVLKNKPELAKSMDALARGAAADKSVTPKHAENVIEMVSEVQKSGDAQRLELFNDRLLDAAVRAENNGGNFREAAIEQISLFRKEAYKEDLKDAEAIVRGSKDANKENCL
ncbi:MAG TPA: hypothetical protein VFV50_18360 [Bdellovibrionales bacterium]|nr:hypothetical protein [Bdellovibrionales bacterium]